MCTYTSKPLLCKNRICRGSNIVPKADKTHSSPLCHSWGRGRKASSPLPPSLPLILSAVSVFLVRGGMGIFAIVIREAREGLRQIDWHHFFSPLILSLSLA